jgi:hypothetical protein
MVTSYTMFALSHMSCQSGQSKLYSRVQVPRSGLPTASVSKNCPGQGVEYWDIIVEPCSTLDNTE